MSNKNTKQGAGDAKDAAPADKADQVQREAARRAEEPTGPYRSPAPVPTPGAPIAGYAPAAARRVTGPFPADAGRPDIDRSRPIEDQVPGLRPALPAGEVPARDPDGNTHILIQSIRPSFRRMGLEATTTPTAVRLDALRPEALAYLEKHHDAFFQVRRISQDEADELDDAKRSGSANQLDDVSRAQLIQDNDRLRGENEALKNDVARLNAQIIGDRPPRAGMGAPGEVNPMPVPVARNMTPNLPATPVADVADDGKRNPLPDA